MVSLRLSESGKAMIKQARQKRGWTVDDDRWLQAATEAANTPPAIGWENYWNTHYASFSPSATTLKRFLQRRNVHIENFQALCAAIGVDWQTVADWETTPIDPAPLCYGRLPTMTQLQTWLDDRQSRVIWLYGRAGMGKTTVARNIFHQSKSLRTAWYSLETAIALPDLVNQLLLSLSQGKIAQGTVADLLHYLKQHRCLVVLDQWETLLASQEQYPDDYQTLLRSLSTGHQSTVFVISRQRLPTLLAQRITPRCYELTGLTYEDDRDFLIAEGLKGCEDDLRKFIAIYNNPQLIKLMAERIRTVHSGSIATLVESGVSIYGNQDIAQVIRSEFRYLSELEQSILYWFALWRRSIDYSELRQSLPDISLPHLDDALYSLISQQSLIRKLESAEYAVDPVTLKEITNLLVEQFAREIRDLIEGRSTSTARLIISHSFVVEDEVIRAEQMQRIVRAIARLLQTKLPLATLRQSIQPLKTQITAGYAAQNLALLEQAIELLA
ncbi:AAA family ATPase [Pseudanabaenaceae cyanobacterium LEGE 13415]|nr:AAA family ATPase [Pseudanabaenaceae cyanobacterium LEGE 13415]